MLSKTALSQGTVSAVQVRAESRYSTVSAVQDSAESSLALSGTALSSTVEAILENYPGSLFSLFNLDQVYINFNL